MRRAVFAFALAASSAFAVSAHAADLATIDCVNQGLSTAGRAALDADLERNLLGGDQSYSDAAKTAFHDAAIACQAKYHWSDDAGAAAITYTLAVEARPVAVKLAKTHPLDVNALFKLFDAMPQADKDHAGDDAVFDKLLNSAMSGGGVNDDNGAFAGGLLGMLAAGSEARHDFATK